MRALFHLCLFLFRSVRKAIGVYISALTPKPSATFAFELLPLEIRLIIFDYVATHEHGSKRLARYATVAKYWREPFEKFTFRTLRITTKDLSVTTVTGKPTFHTIFRDTRRRKYLRRLNFDLQLEEPDEQATLRLLEVSMLTGNTDIQNEFTEQYKTFEDFTKSMSLLFSALTKWKREEVHPDGIGLEIIADTTSYWQETARRLRELNTPGFVNMEILPREAGGVRRFVRWEVDPAFWRRAIREGEVDFNFALDLDFAARLPPDRYLDFLQRRLPPVEVVTGLFILQKTVRRVGLLTLGEIIEQLPHLGIFVWEIWPSIARETDIVNELHQSVSKWPVSLKKVLITHKETRTYARCGGDNPHITPLAFELTNLSQQLTHLSLKHTIDIHAFFDKGPQEWPRLQQLILRSKAQILDQFPGTNHTMLLKAAEVALHMPKLNMFCLYNVHRSAGCF
ncbi:hypothetical protein G7046_g3893 [Stylonectria norvegica]|nr:hypothetical protein G7046_g3893 [Stylonectria norvegica]